MSKIKVNEIESSSTNVKLAAKGSGVVKVKGAGGSDGTLQLNSGTHSVKIKSPAHSAQQSYTMVLPDNNSETGKFLKVKSVTGSGNTATGQLEYATISEPDRANLNASAVTSGTLPAARFGTTISPDVSALQLVSNSTVGATAVSEITVNMDEGQYLLIAKNLIQNNSSANYVRMLAVNYDPNGSYGSTGYWIGLDQYSPGSGNTLTKNRPNWTTELTLRGASSSYSWQQTMGVMVEINNIAVKGTTLVRAMFCANGANASHNWYEGYVSLVQSTRLSGITFKPQQNTWTFTQGSQVLLYQYGEI